MFYEKLSIAIFGLCVYFLLVLHSASEIFEQSRFGRDTISLYKKLSLQQIKFLLTIQGVIYFTHKIQQIYPLLYSPTKKDSCNFGKVMVKYYYLIQDRYYDKQQLITIAY